MQIKEVAERFRISSHAIRFYEKKGLIHVPRNERGVRKFNEETLKRIEAIVHYRKVNMPIEDIRKILENAYDYELSIELLKKLKLNVEEEIKALQQTDEYLSKKIKMHEWLQAEKDSK